MHNIASFLDSTYLKTALQAGISESENITIVKALIQESIDCQFKLVMILPQHVALARKMIDVSLSSVLVGTVIDFPKGTSLLSSKLDQAEKCLQNGADELDFVINYSAFIAEEFHVIDEEVKACTNLCLDNNITIKWIIETAALSEDQIILICNKIKTLVLSRFDEELMSKVFVKSSTGFYETTEGLENGATVKAISSMSKNAHPLSVKASGGVRDLAGVMEMIKAGASRIGTSSALKIIKGERLNSKY
jgi:deoxyribose-phosphate aldolase